jgi:hypothetical protein
MNNKNYWGEPDEVDFPDWMLPDNHPNKNKTMQRKSSHSLTEAINQALAKPPVTIIIEKPE